MIWTDKFSALIPKLDIDTTLLLVWLGAEQFNSILLSFSVLKKLLFLYTTNDNLIGFPLDKKNQIFNIYSFQTNLVTISRRVHHI